MALDWIPTYPDRLIHRPPRRASYTSVEPVSPLPNAAAPDFSSYWAYPNRLNPRPRNPALRSQVVAPIPAEMVLSPILARATYPDRLSRPRQPTRDSGQYPFSVLSAIAISGGWRAVYPDRLNRPRRVVAGQGVWTVDPLTLLNAAGCLHWTDLVLSQPTMSGEVTTLPTMTPDAVTRARFINEIMCDGVLNLGATFLPNLLAGMNMQWLPTYPSQLRRPRSRALYTEYFWRPLN